MEIKHLGAQTGKNRDKPHPQNTRVGKNKFRHWGHDRRNGYPSQST